jgi:hypothetical protein
VCSQLLFKHAGHVTREGSKALLKKTRFRGYTQTDLRIITDHEHTE